MAVNLSAGSTNQAIITSAYIVDPTNAVQITNTPTLEYDGMKFPLFSAEQWASLTNSPIFKTNVVMEPLLTFSKRPPGFAIFTNPFNIAGTLVVTNTNTVWVTNTIPTNTVPIPTNGIVYTTNNSLILTNVVCLTLQETNVYPVLNPTEGWYKMVMINPVFKTNITRKTIVFIPDPRPPVLDASNTYTWTNYQCLSTDGKDYPMIPDSVFGNTVQKHPLFTNSFSRKTVIFYNPDKKP